MDSWSRGSCARCGAKPAVYSFAAADEMRGDAAVNRKRWQEGGGELHVVRDAAGLAAAKAAIASADIIVDALLGTGTRGAVEGVAARSHRGSEPPAAASRLWWPWIFRRARRRIRAKCRAPRWRRTTRLRSPRRRLACFCGKANECCGQLLVRDIGSPWELIEEIGQGRSCAGASRGEFAEFAIPRKPQGNKGDYGHALIVAGSVGKSGAAVLASWAALRAGAGLVTVATPEPALPIVAAHTPEVMTEPLRRHGSGKHLAAESGARLFRLRC